MKPFPVVRIGFIDALNGMFPNGAGGNRFLPEE
jgi:hypothetical protein